MQIVKYNESSNTMRLEYPYGWNIIGLSDVTIGVKTTAGAELLAATSATIYSDTTLASAATAGDVTIDLAVGADAVSPGDRLFIAHSAGGRDEEVEVASYNSTSKEVTVASPLLYGHSSGAAVYGLWATYDLDTTDTDVWPINSDIVITWTPDSGDPVYTERGRVQRSVASWSDLERRFKAVYHREYRQLTEPYRRFDSMVEEAEQQLRMELSLRSLDMYKVVDKTLVMPCMMAMIRWLSLIDVDSERFLDEREIAMSEYKRNLELLLAHPVWIDKNIC